MVTFYNIRLVDDKVFMDGRHELTGEVVSGCWFSARHDNYDYYLPICNKQREFMQGMGNLKSEFDTKGKLPEKATISWG